jgi:3-oxoadipate enol-lactonase
MKTNQIKKHRRSLNGTVISFYDNEAFNKPCILFLHPFPFTKDVWKDQLAYFQNDYRVLAPDFRGFGNSAAGYKPPSINLFAQDIKFFLESQHIERVNICGISMGGYVALQFIKKYPQMVYSLILADTQCREDTKIEITKRYKTVDEIIDSGLLYFSEMILPKMITESTFQFNKVLTGNLKSMINSAKKESIVFTIMALAKREDTCDILNGIDRPALILVGEEDKITPIEEAQYLFKKIKGSVFKIIKNAAHLSNLDNPVSFNESMAVFLEYIGAKKSSRVA